MAIIAKKKYVSLKKSDSESSKLKPLTPESRELKPLLKRISPAEALAQKGLKPLKPAPKELKPLFPKKKELKSLKKTTDLENGGPLYVPTHFRKKEPKLPTFTGSDEKFSYSAVREKIKKEMKTAVLEDADFLPMTWGFDRPRMVLNAPTLDTFRYYVEINDPDVFQYDLDTLAEQNQTIQHKIGQGFVKAGESLALAKRKTLGRSGLKPLRIHPYNTYNTGNITKPGFTPIDLGQPDFYAGFVDDTWIKFWVDQNQEASGSITFSEGPVSSIKRSIDVTYKPNGDNNILWIAKRLNLPEWDIDVGIVRPWNGNYPGLQGYMLQNAYVYFDIFDHITFNVNRGQTAKLNRFYIHLNGQDICKSWEINSIDKQILYEKPYDGFMEMYKWKQKHLGNPESDVLRVAAHELGRAWCIKWGSWWDIAWCSDFAAWVFRNSTLKYFPKPTEQDNYNFSFKNMLKYFIPRNDFISREMDYIHNQNVGEYRWDMLGEVVKPGYYVSVQNGGHSCIFMRWTNGFNENKTINEFRAVGGNQFGTVNIFNRNRTANNGWAYSDESPEHDVSWKGNIYNHYPLFVDDPFAVTDPVTNEKIIVNVYDGFGMT